MAPNKKGWPAHPWPPGWSPSQGRAPAGNLSVLRVRGVGGLCQAGLPLADVPVQALGQALEPVVHQVVAADGRHRVAGRRDLDAAEGRMQVCVFVCVQGTVPYHAYRRVHDHTVHSCGAALCVHTHCTCGTHSPKVYAKVSYRIYIVYTLCRPRVLCEHVCHIWVHGSRVCKCLNDDGDKQTQRGAGGQSATDQSPCWISCLLRPSNDTQAVFLASGERVICGGGEPRGFQSLINY